MGERVVHDVTEKGIIRINNRSITQFHSCAIDVHVTYLAVTTPGSVELDEGWGRADFLWKFD